MQEITTRKQAEDFCDRYIKLIDTIIEFDNSHRGTISSCIPQESACHIYSGLQKLAELLGLETYEKPYGTKGKGYTYLWFVYNGVEFYKLKEEAKND